MVEYMQIINEYFQPGSEAARIYLIHVTLVTRKALEIARRLALTLPEQQFIEEAAMLHDIGISQCDAPGLDCHGSEPYIRHGVAGAEILRAHGLEKHARVAERHIGVGLTRDDIVRQKLPLPEQDFIPETVPEKIITYADNFYSKNPAHLWEEETYEQVWTEMSQFGPGKAEILANWARTFEPEKVERNYVENS